MHLPSSIPLVLAALLAAPPASADTLRCEGRIVATGDRDLEVRARCGEPYWIEQRTDVLVRGEDGPLEQRIAIEVETWYYNFGPNRLMQRLRFRDGVLVDAASLGYGVARIGAGCRHETLPAGITTGEVVARCGRPAQAEQDPVLTIRRDQSGNALAREGRRETWRYADGRSRWRELEFDDGRLVARRTRAR